jgi:hypothetical protein
VRALFFIVLFDRKTAGRRHTLSNSPSVARSPQKFLRLIDLITKLESENGRFALAGVGSIAGNAISDHIKLNTESGDLSWHTASDRWIPEDGLYDHLGLKVGKD